MRWLDRHISFGSILFDLILVDLTQLRMIRIHWLSDNSIDVISVEPY